MFQVSSEGGKMLTWTFLFLFLNCKLYKDVQAILWSQFS